MSTAIRPVYPAKVRQRTGTMRLRAVRYTREHIITLVVFVLFVVHGLYEPELVSCPAGNLAPAAKLQKPVKMRPGARFAEGSCIRCVSMGYIVVLYCNIDLGVGAGGVCDDRLTASQWSRL